MNITKRHQTKIVIALGVLAATLFLMFSFYSQQAHASLAVDTSALADKYRSYETFASSTNETIIATSTSATSTNITAYFDSAGRLINGAIDLRGAKRATWYFSRGDTTGQGNSGKSIFRIQTSRDGVTYNDYSHLLGVDASLTATSTVTISAATSTVVESMDLNGAFYSARCIVQEVTDGEHSCAAAVQY